MVRWAGGLVVVTLAVVVVGGCAGKKPAPDLATAGVGGELGEEALAGGAGSLAQARAGTLGAQGAPTGPLADIHFDYDSFELSEEDRQILQRNANWLNDHPEVRLEVEGHCDERGTIEYNLALGAGRAVAAKNYLIALGLVSDRITTISYGEELPLCYESSQSCWRRNRRARFVAIGD